jgi:acyl carrier protein
MSTMPRVQEQIRQFILQNFLLTPATRAFGDADSLIEWGIVDSTGYLELIDHLEQTFGIQIADEEMTPDNLESLDRMAAFLAGKSVVA